MLKKGLYVFFLIFKISLSVTLTLEEAIDMGIKNSKPLQMAKKDSEIAELNVSSTFKTLLPLFSYNGVGQRSEVDHGVGTLSDPGISKNSYSQDIIITQPIYRGGLLAANIEGAKVTASVYNLTYLATKRDLRLSIISNYMGIISEKLNIESYVFSKKELEKNHEKQKIELEQKLITKSDILKTEYQIYNLDNFIDRSQKNIDIFKKQLLIQIGLNNEKELNVVDFPIPEGLVSKINFDKDMDQAKLSSLNALLAKKNVELSEVNRKIARSALLPEADAFARYGTPTEEATFRDSADNPKWSGGVQVNWDIFQFGRDYDSYKAAKLGVEKANISESNTKDLIEIDLTNAYLTLVNLEKLKKTQEKSLSVAEENYKIDKEKYDASLISTVDFLLTESDLVIAKVAYNTFLINYYLAFEQYRSLLI